MGNIRSTAKETTLKVSVTKMDIAYGRPMNSGQCPVARAVRRAIRNPDADVDVGNYSIDIYDKHLYGMLDNEIATWISMYDHGEPVKPFKFELVLERDLVDERL